jgi:hypothetical protein
VSLVQASGVIERDMWVFSLLLTSLRMTPDSGIGEDEEQQAVVRVMATRSIHVPLEDIHVRVEAQSQDLIGQSISH